MNNSSEKTTINDLVKNETAWLLAHDVRSLYAEGNDEVCTKGTDLLDGGYMTLHKKVSSFNNKHYYEHTFNTTAEGWYTCSKLGKKLALSKLQEAYDNLSEKDKKGL